MNNQSNSWAYRFKNTFPRLYLNFYKRPRDLRYFKHELLSYLNLQDSPSRAPSILLCTMHKSASVHLSSLLGWIAQHTGYIHCNYEHFFALYNLSVYKHLNYDRHLNRLFKPRGFTYGSFRHVHGFNKLAEFDRYKKICVIRDPRDVLVSKYYSVTYSHEIISPSVAHKRKQMQGVDIDAYVLEEAQRIHRIYDIYEEKLIHKPNTLLYTFGEMVNNYGRFITDLLQFCEVEIDQALINQKIAEQANKSSSENKYAHKRKGTTGDYKNKLQDRTVAKIEELLDDIIKRYGFNG